jgi:UPF0755 protein
MRRFLAFLFLLVLVAAAGGAAFLWERANFTAPGPAPAKGEETVVLIPSGAGVSSIAEELQAAGVVENAQYFEWGVRLRGEGKALKAGEYAIPSRASMDDIAGILISGRSIEHKLTIAEGLTSAMAYAIVQNDPTLTGDAGTLPAEGTLLPETYLFTRGTTRSELIEQMETAQKKLLARLWPHRAANLPFTSRRSAIILASIVEKESALPAERRHIAAVFENRLRLGMKLQSDPTIIYGLSKGYPLGHGIRQSELESATPYNTYVIDGLPPTPICNPGKDSIAAVLDPAQSNDLYFVANGSGGHVFAATIAEHEQNVARWRNIERAEKQAGEPAPVPAPKLVQAKRAQLKHRHHRR